MVSFNATEAGANSDKSNSSSGAMDKPTGAIKKELARKNFRVGSCNIATMKVSFRVNESYGQLLVNARMGWTSGANTPTDCLGDNTQIWITLRTPQGDRRYLKLNPGKTIAGDGLGPSGSTSPSWSTLFCKAADDTARCETEDRTRDLIGANLSYEGFAVVAAALSLENLTRNTGSASKILDRAALDSRLSNAIDGTFNNGASSSTANSRPTVINDAKDARGAVQKIITLLAASLSQYTIDAHACESKRTVSQWVQVKDQCQMSFRSESQHDYLCEADQVSRPIRSTSNVTINLGQDLTGPGIVKVSDDGWSALVLALNADMTVHTEAKFNTDRWQITANNSKLDDLEEVARQLNALNGFCGGKKPS
ncbi:MAG: hypothetical protein ACJARY_001981 [Candidatus Azotimanducaceae bacterium]|jgi:hypothetical protein